MRIRSLASAALLAGGLIATATPATAATVAPAQRTSCSLTVTNLYYSIGMQTAFAKLTGGCSGPIDITLERAATAAGPYQEEPEALYYLQQAADGTAATAYFMDPAERGQCRAKASFDTLVAYSPASVSC
ncbi:hypothetical protein CA850_20670 [Micromonospora echinospora]|uniref:Uncharacterized protein n=1 Tax=Micromonospora echinospora TaxID=1877 RepID=A0A1C4Z622_MICEC|nr:hypothetical protein [Micromonospora echinospora]OZV78224.1 hypothetical protein CA850_20670 [Micromonospora echinospora]SCF28383.1 hypothetical protein GA0070618_4815 [Micromonospora echinospora]